MTSVIIDLASALGVSERSVRAALNEANDRIVAAEGRRVSRLFAGIQVSF